MKNIEIRKVKPENIIELQEISARTFTETFYLYNSKEDMDKYIAKAFSKEKLSSELNIEIPNSTLL